MIYIAIYSDDYNRTLLAEIYDQALTYTADVDLLRSLIRDEEELAILECFSGTGRILIPLLEDGHRVTGIEIAEAMAARARDKATALALSDRLTILVQDALSNSWGRDQFDVVVLGGNAMFELTTDTSQQSCIQRAYEALKPGGRLFLDSNNWTEPLCASVGSRWVALEGTGADGTYARQSAETVAADPEKGLLHIKRTWYTRTIDGVESTEEYMTSKRPVSGAEVQGWVESHGFRIIKSFGDVTGEPRTETSKRAIFWAEK